MTGHYVGRHRTLEQRPGAGVSRAWSIRLPVALVTAAGFGTAAVAASRGALEPAAGVQLAAPTGALIGTAPSGVAADNAQSAVAPDAAAQDASRLLLERTGQQARATRLAARSAATVKLTTTAVAQVGRIAKAHLAAGGNDPKSIARVMMQQSYGWGDAEFACLDRMWMRESRWKHPATNPSSGAYGIPQALPAGKLASAGADWRTNPATQIAWGLKYVKDRYHTPCGAWSFWQGHSWY